MVVVKEVEGTEAAAMVAAATGAMEKAVSAAALAGQK